MPMLAVDALKRQADQFLGPGRHGLADFNPVCSEGLEGFGRDGERGRG
jgi:hypothetical protein